MWLRQGCKRRGRARRLRAQLWPFAPVYSSYRGPPKWSSAKGGLWGGGKQKTLSRGGAESDFLGNVSLFSPRLYITFIMFEGNQQRCECSAGSETGWHRHSDMEKKEFVAIAATQMQNWAWMPSGHPVKSCLWAWTSWTNPRAYRGDSNFSSIKHLLYPPKQSSEILVIFFKNGNQRHQTAQNCPSSGTEGSDSNLPPNKVAPTSKSIGQSSTKQKHRGKSEVRKCKLYCKFLFF